MIKAVFLPLFRSLDRISDRWKKVAQVPSGLGIIFGAPDSWVSEYGVYRDLEKIIPELLPNIPS